MSISLVPAKAIIASVSSPEESPSNVRSRALFSPQLSRRMPALQLGLTDPDSGVRLAAASQIARVLEVRFQEGGLAPVVTWLTASVGEPTLYFKNRDPRLSSPELFDSERSVASARLGGLMVVQAIMQKPDSSVRGPLATYLKEQGLFEHLKAGRQDRAFLERCLEAGLAMPPFDFERGDAIGFLMHSFKYSVAVAAYQNSSLRAKFFPDVSERRAESLRSISSRVGILNTLGQIGRTVVEAERDHALARELAAELSMVVGVVFSSRLPEHLRHG